ncbi:hypothetical protein IFR05_014522 [Cadophora sp. M221]|nr:hypothetical protein IFR05_014522 [Cadophora sp. M221]
MADSRSDRIKDRKCWTKFNIEFQAQAYNRGLWPLVDPDGPDVPSPATNPPVFNTETEFLQKKNAERLAGAPAILFSEVESEYNRAFKVFIVEKSDWSNLVTKYNQLYTWVIDHIDPSLFEIISLTQVNEHAYTIQKIVRELRQHVAPSKATNLREPVSVRIRGAS